MSDSESSGTTKRENLFKAFEKNLQVTMSRLVPQRPDTTEEDEKRPSASELQRVAARLESDESDDGIMQKYAALVGNRPPASNQDDDDDLEDEDDDQKVKSSARQYRHGLVHHKIDQSGDSEQDDADEMDNVNSSQDEANQIGSRISGQLAQGFLSKGSISPTALKMMAETAEKSDRSNQQTLGGLEIRQKLGLGNESDSVNIKKEVYNAYPVRGRKPLIAQDEEEEEEEGDEDDEEEGDDREEEKEKLLTWKKELEEKFKKFEAFKDGKQQNDSKQLDDISESGQKSYHIQKSQYEYSSLVSTSNHPKTSSHLPAGKGEQRDSELSRPSNSIRIKDEIMANKGKDSFKRPEPNDIKQSFEKNNFFTGLDSKQNNDSFRIEQEREKKESRSNETDALRQRVAELEAELIKNRRENEASMKQVIENNQKTVQNTRSQYEREIDHLKEQLEEAYIQIKDLEKKQGKTNTFGGSNLVHKSIQTADDPLEKNFLKLKELYDTLYKANVALVKDQKELQDKYTKLLKVQTKTPKTKEETKAPIKIKHESPIRQNKGSTTK